MAKKKLDVKTILGVDSSLTGRKPKRPKQVDGRLDQLVKESETWMRLFGEVWFNPDDPLIELAIGASELPNLGQSYDDAVKQMRMIEACAAYAQKALKKGKSEAIRKAAEKAEASAGSKSVKTRR